MLTSELLNLAAALATERGIDAEAAFSAIEQAILAAAKLQFPRVTLAIRVHRETGAVEATADGVPIQPEDMFCRNAAVNAAVDAADGLVREAEHAAIFERFRDRRGELFEVTVTKAGDVATVAIENATGTLACECQIPGDVAKRGQSLHAVLSRVRMVAGRCRLEFDRAGADFLKALCAKHMPAVAAGKVTIRSVAREAGYRSKIAVASTTDADPLDVILGDLEAVCAELGGERLDLVRWRAQREQYVAEALRPAAVDAVAWCPMAGYSLAFVTDDGELQRASGRQGQNIRLASHLVGHDIELTTVPRWSAKCVEAVARFEAIGISHAAALAAEGVIRYDQLADCEPGDVAKACHLSLADAQAAIDLADEQE